MGRGREWGGARGSGAGDERHALDCSTPVAELRSGAGEREEEKAQQLRGVPIVRTHTMRRAEKVEASDGARNTVLRPVSASRQECSPVT